MESSDQLTNENGENTSLSSLTDELLIEILSHLPIKSAGATSAVSRRWRHLWTAVTRFNHTSTTVEPILRQLTSSKLHVFNLDWSSEPDFPGPDPTFSWFAEICRRNVEHVRIKAASKERGAFSFFVPLFLFSCNSLVTLTLYGSLVFGVPFIGGLQFDLPNLKELTFYQLVQFSPDWLENLISSCPILSYLCIKFEIGYYFDSIKIDAVSLESLRIGLDSDSTQRIKFYINAPKLVDIELNDHCSFYYLVQIPTSLDSLCIDLSDVYNDSDTMVLPGDEFYLGHVSMFVRELSSVTYLGLNVCAETNVFDHFSTVAVGDSVALPVFHNLIHLQVIFQRIGLHCWTNLLASLQFFPNLTHMDVTMIDDPPIKQWTWCEPELVPGCLVNKLKMIRIKGLRRSDADIELLGYILRNAAVLNHLWIHVGVKGDHDGSEARFAEGHKFYGSLSKLPTKSPTCEIVSYA